MGAPTKAPCAPERLVPHTHRISARTNCVVASFRSILAGRSFSEIRDFEMRYWHIRGCIYAAVWYRTDVRPLATNNPYYFAVYSVTDEAGKANNSTNNSFTTGP